ncbi:MAG TPA: class II D-tagatose-bisphosphate aldolase, non-catalytic subunit, partial [Thermoleophilia bacterium]|nr:class II D-tagatose-bisphosphate aldolase, non-catalytic subunit [Thermoleophilia bacterium]
MSDPLPNGRTTTDVLLEMVASNRAGRRAGLYSICSAERFVLEAAMARAASDRSLVCIESTCNQVNQDGGYTGMTPAGFRRFVAEVAGETGFDGAHVVLGGDHLGPHPWRAGPAEAAMAKARDLVRDCVLAGYTKIHLDASMRLGGDPGAPGSPPDDALAARRTGELAEVAEAAWGGLPAGSPPPLYVVGTEVPVPGGETAGSAAPAVTSPQHAARTLELTGAEFSARGLGAAWDRVIALVVQPGVEFGSESVYAYDRAKARALVDWLEHQRPLLFEAHSTDYQPAAALASLVSDHFAVLKVGPALTHAFSEAVLELERDEVELLGAGAAGLSRLRETLERALADDPAHWRPYAADGSDAQRDQAAFGPSDRVRYYWARPDVREALDRLLENLATRRGAAAAPASFICDRIRGVIAPYAEACG